MEEKTETFSENTANVDSTEKKETGKRTKRSKKQNLLFVTVGAVLTALIVVMSFTPIGFIKIGVLEITLVMVPVIVGAVSFGVGMGAFLGLVFGVMSFVQCFTGSPLGAILVAESIPKTLITCVVPRVLAGLLCGLIFSVCKKHDRKKGWSYLVGSLSGSILNSLLFLGCLALLFFGMKFTPEQASALGGLKGALDVVIATAFSINCPIELVVCGVLGTAIAKAVDVSTKKMRK